MPKTTDTSPQTCARAIRELLSEIEDDGGYAKLPFFALADALDAQSVVTDELMPPDKAADLVQLGAEYLALIDALDALPKAEKSREEYATQTASDYSDALEEIRRLRAQLAEIRIAAESAGWSSHAPIAAFITEQQQRLADLRAAVRKWDAAVHGDGWPASVFPVVAEADATLLSTVADMDAPPPLPTDCPECGHAHAMHFPLKAGCAVYGCDCTSKVYMTEDQ
jgi:hypothetical protein